MKRRRISISSIGSSIASFASFKSYQSVYARVQFHFQAILPSINLSDNLQEMADKFIEAEELAADKKDEFMVTLPCDIK